MPPTADSSSPEESSLSLSLAAAIYCSSSDFGFATGKTGAVSATRTDSVVFLPSSSSLLPASVSLISLSLSLSLSVSLSSIVPGWTIVAGGAIVSTFSSSPSSSSVSLSLSLFPSPSSMSPVSRVSTGVGTISTSFSSSSSFSVSLSPSIDPSLVSCTSVPDCTSSSLLSLSSSTQPFSSSDFPSSFVSLSFTTTLSRSLSPLEIGVGATLSSETSVVTGSPLLLSIFPWPADIASGNPMRPPTTQRRYEGQSSHSFLGFIECLYINSPSLLFAFLNAVTPWLPLISCFGVFAMNAARC
mmetsp:Transcript_14196/g.23510  ORF Transcript_14196/g.23510 Transcript_14196/m.23510 type:complete len:299 (+) Transcript_14196:586-1482(+)